MLAQSITSPRTGGCARARQCTTLHQRSGTIKEGCFFKQFMHRRTKRGLTTLAGCYKSKLNPPYISQQRMSSSRAVGTKSVSCNQSQGGQKSEKKGKMKSEASQGDEGGTTCPLRVAIICGGPSAERGISLNSARSVLDHLQVEILNSSEWLSPECLNQHKVIEWSTNQNDTSCVCTLISSLFCKGAMLAANILPFHKGLFYDRFCATRGHWLLLYTFSDSPSIIAVPSVAVS